MIVQGLVKPAWAAKVRLGPQELIGGSGGAFSVAAVERILSLGVLRCPMLREERTSNIEHPRSVDDPGCVKTQKSKRGED